MLHSSQQKEYLQRLEDFITSYSEQERWKVVQYCVRKSVGPDSSIPLIKNEIEHFFGQVICRYTKPQGAVTNLNHILRGDKADNKQAYQIGPYAVLLDGIIRYRCKDRCDDKKVYRRDSSKLITLEKICDHITNHKIAYWSRFPSTYKSEGQEGINKEIKRSESKYDLLFIINTEKSDLKACYINEYSMYPDQHECLYPPATPIRYTSIRKYKEANKEKHSDTSIKYIVDVIVEDPG